jgi:hypothetical protein
MAFAHLSFLVIPGYLEGTGLPTGLTPYAGILVVKDNTRLFILLHSPSWTNGHTGWLSAVPTPLRYENPVNLPLGRHPLYEPYPVIGITREIRRIFVSSPIFGLFRGKAIPRFTSHLTSPTPYTKIWHDKKPVPHL